ncbi:MAG TPA: Hsp20/alpha crystallin family protein, partial [Sphingomicrobium sp.]|nr:Hsp20/alpha crystallin family protein [Sphingomicrobium sp.]
FDDFFSASALPNFGSGAAGWPSVEVDEDDKEVRVSVELPGLTEKDVDVLLDNGALTIRGVKKGEKTEGAYSERWYGRFERRIPMTSPVDEGRSRADFQNGVLTVTLPKLEGAESRKRIPINQETRH